MSKFTLKKFLKKKVQQFTFEQLIYKKDLQSKGSDITYSKLSMQPYLKSKLLTTQLKKVFISNEDKNFPCFC